MSCSPPLDGVRVLDLSRVLAGPTCTQMLADMGADVIKVESPQGDETRRFGPPFVGTESTYYLAANRGKRSIVIDLKQKAGQALLHRLVAWADVVVDNFKPGGAHPLGADYETLRRINERLIHASISGYGKTGDAASTMLPAYDLVVQGMGGVASLTGEVDGAPHKTGVPVADLVAGLNAAGAVLAALFARTQHGRGCFLDISLFDGQLALLSSSASAWLNAGIKTPRMGNAHPNICPYEVFEVADGHLSVACGNDGQFARLCQCLGIALELDPRFSTNPARVAHRDALTAIVRPILKSKTREAWLKIFAQANVPAGPILAVDEALAHPQTHARQRVVHQNHPTLGTVLGVASALGDAVPTHAHRHPPLLGEHTREVLREVLGLGEEQIATLIGDAVVSVYDPHRS